MVSQFHGMSSREIRGMPRTWDATWAQLAKPPADGSVGISRDQEAYVRAVYEACPSWRRFKKRRLAAGLARATFVREMNEDIANRWAVLPAKSKEKE